MVIELSVGACSPCWASPRPSPPWGFGCSSGVSASGEAVQDAREAAREQNEVLLIQNTRAALALAEATAVAVQRIPDAHCNGDMHAALEYARKVKHAQKDFF